MRSEDERQAIRDMVHSAGWKLVEAYIQARAKDHKSRLMSWSTDQEGVIKYRAAAEAVESVLIYVQETLREDEEA